MTHRSDFGGFLTRRGASRNFKRKNPPVQWLPMACQSEKDQSLRELVPIPFLVLPPCALSCDTGPACTRTIGEASSWLWGYCCRRNPSELSLRLCAPLSKVPTAHVALTSLLTASDICPRAECAIRIAPNRKDPVHGTRVEVLFDRRQPDKESFSIPACR